MKSPPILRILTLSITVLLWLTSSANAQTPSRRIRDSQILPYLLNNPNDSSLVKVRCLPRERQQADRNRGMIRDYLLRPNLSDCLRHCAWRNRNQTVTIEIEGSCENIKIRLQQDSPFSDLPAYNSYLDNYHSDFDDSWLTRKGSGWYWLLHHP